MNEIYSTELPFICETIQKTLDDLNGVAYSITQKENGIKSDQIDEYGVIKKFVSDDGQPIAILSSRFSYTSNWLEFLVMFNDEYYKKLAITDRTMIDELELNIKNRVLKTPTFLLFFTFNDSEIEVVHKIIASKNLKIKYTNCLVEGFKELYEIGSFMTWENCVFANK